MADALTSAAILGQQRPLEFVHPIVRRAIYCAISPSDRALLHRRAARLPQDGGGSPEAIAGHLLSTDPEGASWTVAALRSAAARALERGAPDAAVAYLRRALAEPPAASAQAAVLTALGDAELQASELVGPDEADEACPASACRLQRGNRHAREYGRTARLWP